MCGICGFAGDRNETLLRAMTASLLHRGPDEEGFFSDEERVSLGMRRLRVIDLAGGSQPVFNEDGTVAVVFNGEIYNFRELRRDLEAAGHRFKTNSDTEVLVHLYEVHGEKFPKLLRGMFAFALWDSKERKLLLCRDQFGIKPLYYAAAGEKLYFASELKALRLVSGLCGELDPAAIDYYFTYLYIPAPLTIYRGVSKLEPGTVLVFRDGAARTEKYWSPPPVSEKARPEEDYAGEIKTLLSAGVKEQLVSDVPLGLLLSGGLDSTALLSFMAEHAGGKVKAFTASFGDPDFDETAAAAAAARRYGAEHILIPVKADIGGTIRKLASHFDEPFADSSALANYLVTREARGHVTVALAGIGGDELFAGYPRHLGARALPAYLALPGALRRLAGGAASLLPESRSSFNFPGRVKRFLASGGAGFGRAYNSWLAYLTPDEKRDFYSLSMYSAHSAAELPGLPRDADGVCAFELGSYLPDDLLCLADRASMANSLELRVPFLDVRLAELMASVPLADKTRGFTSKYLLKRALEGRFPPEVAGAPKRGFQVPLARWQERELKAFTAEALNPAAVRNAGVLSPRGVEEMLKDHASGRRNLYDRIYAASVFHLWYENARHNPPAALGRPWQVRGGRRKVLLVNMAGIGDLIMMTPAVRALRSAYPDAYIELLTIDRSKELAAGIPGIDKVRSVPIRYRWPGPRGLWAFFRELLALRGEKFDALVNFSLVSSSGGLLKTRLINLLAGPAYACCRVMRGFGRAGDFTAWEEYAERESEAALTARLLAPLGVEVRDLEVAYPVAEEARRRTAADLAALGGGRPRIGFNPGAFKASHRWPLERWKELAALIFAKYPEARIVVGGSPGEKALADSLSEPGRVVSVAGAYSIAESAALYSQLDLFISNDTGAMHLAAAAGAKVVGIFGPGDHFRFSPLVPDQRRRVVRREAENCELPCYREKCRREPNCLSDITPGQVFAAAEELLE